MSTIKDKISAKFLIHLVGERPALWDKTSEAYKERSLREVSWHEICAYINEDYDRMAPQARQQFQKMVSKKWTYIRDAWVKSMKNGYDEETMMPPKPYLYHNELHFMQKIFKLQRPSKMNSYFVDGKQRSNYCGPDIDNGEDSDDIPTNVITGGKHAKNVSSLKNRNGIQTLEDDIDHSKSDSEDEDWPSDSNDIDVMKETVTATKLETTNHTKRATIIPETTITTTTSKQRRFQDRKRKRAKSNNVSSIEIQNDLNENRHWNFFKGILPSVNQLDDNQTLHFQAGVIGLLQKLRNRMSNKSTNKRKHSEDSNYDWPVCNIELPNGGYTTRSYQSKLERIDPLKNGAEDIDTKSDAPTEVDDDIFI